MKPQDLEDRLIEFASRIIDLVEALPKGPIARHLGGQLVRSGTSPALNYGEARGAESPSDSSDALAALKAKMKGDKPAE